MGWVGPCRVHAADVLRNVHVITTRGGLLKILGSKRLKAGAQKALGSKSHNALSHGGAGRHSKPGSPRTSRRNLIAPGNSTLLSQRGMSGFQQGIRLNSGLPSVTSNAAGPLSPGTSPAAPSTSNPAPSSAAGQEFVHANPASQDAMVLLCQYLSAVIHDHDHRGVTNAFLILDQHPLAVSKDIMFKSNV
jgi:hypothetical protein